MELREREPLTAVVDTVTSSSCPSPASSAQVVSLGFYFFGLNGI